MKEENKMAVVPMKKLFWSMGLPMIISMVLQALYNVVDSIFVTNMGEDGATANLALTYAFPIQILIIAIGVGTGVGLNAILSKSLGENKKEVVNKIAGTGIFLSFIIYAVFLLFGLFGSSWFISLFTQDANVIAMGGIYLKICCSLSLGSVGYTVFERFLQATGKTNLSTISQISGALTNIVLDYVFIYPLNMGVAGAAWATIIGQFVSLFVAMFFHYTKNHEIDGNPKYIRPNFELIKGIYAIGISAALMQTLLAVMMAGVNAILGLSAVNQEVLTGSFGIYYKIQQIALFSAFGLSNTIISICSFNYGMKNKSRVNDCIKYGIIDTMIVTLVLTLVFEVFAHPLASLFGLAGGTTTEIIDTCTIALRIASIGYIFMGVSVAIQGVLQSIRYALRPLIISLFRLVIFVFPIVFLFVQSENVTNIVWWAFPIAEFLTAIISLLILKKSYNERIAILPDAENAIVEENKQENNNLIVCISREHGTKGKGVAKELAKALNIPYFDKEQIKEFAKKNEAYKELSEKDLYDDFMSLDVSSETMILQSEIIKDIARSGNAVIVGRAADYILSGNKNVVRIFLYGDMEFKIKNIMEMYNDTREEAIKNIEKSTSSRAKYYELISNKSWGDKSNYDLCINCNAGTEKVVSIIKDYIDKIKA